MYYLLFDMFIALVMSYVTLFPTQIIIKFIHTAGFFVGKLNKHFFLNYAKI